MNYRHAFHAGNHTEVFKHAALTLILEHLLQKPTPFAVLDTHGGIGIYDLCSDEAMRTNERDAGVNRVFGRTLSSAPRYLKTLESLNAQSLRIYPGSPELVRQSLREKDRLNVCELHPEDGSLLKERYRKDRRVSVHQRDGYEAIGAMLPPRERRGLVFIDPPFERKDEPDQIAAALQAGNRRWATGIYAIWYPIKDAVLGDCIAAAATAAGFNSVLRTEFCPYRRDGVTLAGSGLIICNPPWRIDDRLRRLCKELAVLLGGKHSSWSVELVPGC
ncbi:23S rRNA (adenine(2030)-N(6))-methyltransferase RlmJ [Mesorhizobium sp. B2-5-13]|uniref:23S rRNA (adenine(2030)-N(6))-methyltransferase RlmJ n=1 Tax=unclassified Mesorhizobium TaxID=325217 RepID=UPI00112B04F1|nr:MULTISPECIES: 23S rRNA (adenine(2030)-N(6))-methyltransferase RlmJ [unclassified Mesorhizobium]TPJ43464.1 23S rRNA (adenine(2030)-N(6))-methyltransferase RlmJ [Mesorhizobium sp. B2-6-5]TPJ93354.1 23S rRNA (adenine(2030)-N(6))-methyltransferase RlmJ [Mesorhizobium sp. B2-5-13]TPK47561.1 23S rRNA (adenine(2030)-N(6))-methyltransferase RlmJ [Mesorhizobium sp. B2-5-5]